MSEGYPRGAFMGDSGWELAWVGDGEQVDRSLPREVPSGSAGVRWQRPRLPGRFLQACLLETLSPCLVTVSTLGI